MKKIILFLSMLTLTTLLHAAEYWVFVTRDGVTTFIITTTKPYKGDGVTIFGPFPDGTWTKPNQTVPITISGTTVTPLKEPTATLQTKAAVVAKDLALVYFNKNKEMVIVKCTNNLPIGEYLVNAKANKMAACEGCGKATVMRLNFNKNNYVTINGIAIKAATATVNFNGNIDKKHGDILIDNIPIEGY